jgi:hypothetical protein
MKKNYFKTTFVFVFVFILTMKIVGELLEGANFTKDFLLKTLFASIVTAIVLGILNHFAKIDFSRKK